MSKFWPLVSFKEIKPNIERVRLVRYVRQINFIPPTLSLTSFERPLCFIFFDVIFCNLKHQWLTTDQHGEEFNLKLNESFLVLFVLFLCLSLLLRGRVIILGYFWKESGKTYSYLGTKVAQIIWHFLGSSENLRFLRQKDTLWDTYRKNLANFVNIWSHWPPFCLKIVLPDFWHCS